MRIRRCTACCVRSVGETVTQGDMNSWSRMLANREWLTGPQKSLADAYFIGLARWGKYHRVVTPGQYPKLDRLIEKLEADPAVIFAHAIEDERTGYQQRRISWAHRIGRIEPKLAACQKSRA